MKMTAPRAGHYLVQYSDGKTEIVFLEDGEPIETDNEKGDDAAPHAPRWAVRRL